MPKFRLPSRSRRRASWIAAGVAVAIVALPGVGLAAPSLPPFPTLPVTPGQVAAALPGPQSAACSRIVADDLTALFTDLATPPTQLPTSLSDVLAALTSALGRPPTAAELVAALEALGPGSLGGGTLPVGGAGTNTNTQSGQNDSPLNQASTDLAGGTGDTGGSASPAVTTTGNPADVPKDLQQLASDFLTFCVPAPPSLPATPTTPSSSSGGQQQQPTTQQDTSAATQSETPPVTQPAAQPVSYPGYAATGGIASTALRPASDQRPSETIPLSVLGGVLLVSTAAAVGVRSRARRNGR